MQISFENPDKVNGLLTMTVEENDFKDDVEKTLKTIASAQMYQASVLDRFLWALSSASSAHQ